MKLRRIITYFQVNIKLIYITSKIIKQMKQHTHNKITYLIQIILILINKSKYLYKCQRVLSCDVNNNQECLQQIEDQIQNKKVYLQIGIDYIWVLNSQIVRKLQRNFKLCILIQNAVTRLLQQTISKDILNWSNLRILFLKLNNIWKIIQIFQQNLKNYIFRVSNQKIIIHYFSIRFKSILILLLNQNYKILFIQKIKKQLIYELFRYVLDNQKFKNIIDLNYSDLSYFHLLNNDVILKDKYLLSTYDINHLSILKLVEIKYIKFELQTQTLTFQIEKKIL
ncbi:unnamed protein product [Paramecium sonneborni]|uniref:Uncharacterized protein n=1 Tax=Paramecium sonneborni TaxID=65129 RepID=A0A8S1RPB0_9CILI|nr:unnamed protein product [Paramecium sonneborni]